MAGNYGRVGAYGLELNFGTYYQPPIAPPNTLVTAAARPGRRQHEQRHHRRGRSTAAPSRDRRASPGPRSAAYTGWVDAYTASRGRAGPRRRPAARRDRPDGADGRHHRPDRPDAGLDHRARLDDVRGRRAHPPAAGLYACGGRRAFPAQARPPRGGQPRCTDGQAIASGSRRRQDSIGPAREWFPRLIGSESAARLRRRSAAGSESPHRCGTLEPGGAGWWIGDSRRSR